MTDPTVKTDDKGRRYVEVTIGVMVPKMRGEAAQRHQARLGIIHPDKQRGRSLPLVMDFFDIKISEDQYNKQKEYFDKGPVYRIYWNELKRGQVFSDEYGKLILSHKVLFSTDIISQ